MKSFRNLTARERFSSIFSTIWAWTIRTCATSWASPKRPSAFLRPVGIGSKRSEIESPTYRRHPATFPQDTRFFVTKLQNVALQSVEWEKVGGFYCHNSIFFYQRGKAIAAVLKEMEIICAKKLKTKKLKYRFFIVHYGILKSAYTHH